MLQCSHNGPIVVVKETCPKVGVIGTYFLDDVNGGSSSNRTVQQQWKGGCTFWKREEGENMIRKVTKNILYDYDRMIHMDAQTTVCD